LFLCCGAEFDTGTLGYWLGGKLGVPLKGLLTTLLTIFLL